MNKLKEWFTDEVKFRIVRIMISGIALALSLGGRFTLPFGMDFAWIAIILHIAKLIGRICGAKRPHSVTEQPIFTYLCDPILIMMIAIRGMVNTSFEEDNVCSWITKTSLSNAMRYL